MIIFRKSKRHQPVASPLMLQLSSLLERMQRRLATVLARGTAHWSRRSWIIALVLFMLLFGGYCLFLCVQVFTHF
jgi:hypothetical protein